MISKPKDGIQFSNISCELNDITYGMSRYYSLHLKKISLNGRDSSLELHSLKMIPKLGKIEFGQRLGHQADRIEATVENIKVSGLDVMRLQQKKFFAAGLSVSNSRVYVFRDRRL